MGDPFDDPPSPGADRSGADRVRPRASVTSPGMPSGDDDDNIFGATLSGKTPVAPRAEVAPPARGRTDPSSSSSSSSSMSGSGPAERGTDPGLRPPPSRNRSGLMVVRAAELVVPGPPPAPALNPALLPPRRVQTAPPPPQPPSPPLVDLDSLLSPGASPPMSMSLDDLLAPSPPPPPALSTGSRPRPTAAPPTPMGPTTGGFPRPAMGLDPGLEPSGSRPRPAAVTGSHPRPATGAMSLDPPVESSAPSRRPSGLMSLDPPVESSAPTRRPTGLMSLDPVVEPSTPTKRPATQITGSFGRPAAPPPARVATNPALAAMGIADDDGPPMAPRLPAPTGLREDGSAMSAAEAALPSLFKTPEQVQRRRIQIAASGVTLITLGLVTVVLWVANRPPPPRTGSTLFAVADKATVTTQYLAGVVRLDNADVQPVVARVVATIARPMLPKDAKPPVVVLTDEAEPVAFSTPDGRLVFSRGLLKALTSQAELAALAAHLLAHQTRFHLDDALDAESKALLPDVKVAMTSNLATPGSTRVATVGLWHTFTDAEEREADADAVIALKRATWDAAALRTLWQRLDAQGQKPALLAHHPLTLDRVAALEAAEKLRLQGSDLVKGDAERTNSVEYQAQIKDVLDPPVIVVKAATTEEPPPPPSEPVSTRITTQAVEPKVAPKKPAAPAPPPTPTSPRDPND